MVVYLFGNDEHGAYCRYSKTIGEPIPYVNPRCKLMLMSVLLDPNGGIDKKSVVVPVRAQLVYNRCFWLDEVDEEKAGQIIDDYCYKKAMKDEEKAKAGWLKVNRS